MADWIRKAREWISEDLTSTARAVAKWYFDLIKNTFVVVVLWFTWKKTGDPIVFIVASVTFGVFLLYILSYPLMALFAILNYNSRSRSSLLALLAVILGGIAFYGAVAAISLAALEVINALLSAQGSIK